MRDQTEFKEVWSKLDELMEDIIRHSGFAELHIDVRWVKKNRKEVILSCGKQFRYLVDLPPEMTNKETTKNSIEQQD